MFKQLIEPELKTVQLSIAGNPVEVLQGTTVAAATLAQGLPYTRTTAISAEKRAPFCLMGVCYECLMVINGQANQRACMTQVEQGMVVECQQGTGLLNE